MYFEVSVVTEVELHQKFVLSHVCSSEKLQNGNGSGNNSCFVVGYSQ